MCPSRITILICVFAMQAELVAQSKPTFEILPKAREANLALAVSEASRGAFDAALSRIDRDLAAGGEALAVKRHRLERDRIAKVVAVRTEWLERLAAKKASFAIWTGGKKERLRVVGIRDGVIRVRNRKKVESDLLDDGLDALSLFRNLRAYREVKFMKDDRAWIGAYLKLLAGDTKGIGRYWKTGEIAKALQAEREDYPELLVRGRRLEALESLGLSATKGETRDASAILATIGELTRAAAIDDVIAARMDDMRVLAESCLDTTWDPASARCLGLHGVMKSGSGNRVTVAYDFSSADQLLDFEERQWLQSMRSENPLKGDVADSGTKWNEGRARLAGEACLVHQAIFRGPVVMRYDLVYRDGGEQKSDGDFFIAGLMGTKRKSRFLCRNLGHIETVNGRTGIRDVAAAKTGKVIFGQPYEVKLEVDEKGKVVSRVGGEEMATLRGTPKLPCRAFFWCQSHRPFEIARFEIEGSVDEAFVASRKGPWISARLAEAGFDVVLSETSED